VVLQFIGSTTPVGAIRGVPRGDAQDARASPPPQPERLAMRKDEAVGNKKKIIKISLKSI
jgi:hypothetical protein